LFRRPKLTLSCSADGKEGIVIISCISGFQVYRSTIRKSLYIRLFTTKSPIVDVEIREPLTEKACRWTLPCSTSMQRHTHILKEHKYLMTLDRISRLA
jgi:hypothetical protein